jgi:hypothetical protein
MLIRIAPSERGNSVAIKPAQGGSAGGQRGQKRGADRNSAAENEDAGTSEQTTTAPTNGHIDKLA